MMLHHNLSRICGAMLPDSSNQSFALTMPVALYAALIVCVCCCSVLQGLLSSFFYKFADTILKKYSSTIATIFTAIMSWTMFGHQLTINFLIGVSIVFVSMHQFFSFGDKVVAGQKVPVHQADTPITPVMVYSPSLDHIRVSDENGVVVGDHGRALLLPR